MSAYDDVPLDLLRGLYAEIYKNIQKGNLTEVMYSELDLMQQAANRKGVRFLPTHK
ncbi:hypothetical protein [Halobacillus seohaensis]|uniref:Uncharacterized protein n=1 Tax=Halobacillus seohaensis TaxID=447421 RepID=A0ABW2EQ18_9BACI